MHNDCLRPLETIGCACSAARSIPCESHCHEKQEACRPPLADRTRGHGASVGLRSTHARLAVLGHFHRRGEPQTHADVAAAWRISASIRPRSTAIPRAGRSRSARAVEPGRSCLAIRNGQPHGQRISSALSLCGLRHGLVSRCRQSRFGRGQRLSRLAKDNPIGQVTEVLLKGHCNQCR